MGPQKNIPLGGQPNAQALSILKRFFKRGDSTLRGGDLPPFSVFALGAKFPGEFAHSPIRRNVIVKGEFNGNSD
jgi:hypothetical protein